MSRQPIWKFAARQMRNKGEHHGLDDYGHRFRDLAHFRCAARTGVEGIHSAGTHEAMVAVPRAAVIVVSKWTCASAEPTMAPCAIRPDASCGLNSSIGKSSLPSDSVWVHSFSDEAGGLTRHPMSPTWPLELLTTVTFEEAAGEKTKLTLRWLPINATEEERRTFEAAHDGMRQGWGGSFDQLAAYLGSTGYGARRKYLMMAAASTKPFDAEREVTITRVFDAPRALVFAAWTDPQTSGAVVGPEGLHQPRCANSTRGSAARSASTCAVRTVSSIR